jgi:predicted RND superfamily exporter protein
VSASPPASRWSAPFLSLRVGWVVVALLLCTLAAVGGAARLDPRVDLAALVAAQAGLDKVPAPYVLVLAPEEQASAVEAALEAAPQVARRLPSRVSETGDVVWPVELWRMADPWALTTLVEAAGGEQVRVAGLHELEAAMTAINRSAQPKHFLGVATAFVGLLSLLLQRRAGVVIALGAPALGCLWLAGVAGWTGLKLSGPNVLVLPIVLVLGLADTVHLLRRVEEERAAGAGRRSLERALEAVVAPCFWTSLTTAIGFLGLMAAGSPVLSRFGALVAAGVGIAWCVGLAVPVVALRMWPDLAVARPPGAGVPGPLRPRLAVGVLLTLGVVGLGAATQVRADVRVGADLPKDDAVWERIEEADERAGGMFPIVATLRAPEDRYAPSLVPTSEQIRRSLEPLPVVGHVQGVHSALEHVRGADRMLSSGPRDPWTRQARRRVVDELAERVPGVKDGEVPLVVGVKLASGRQWSAVLRRMESAVRPPLVLEASGYPVSVARMVDRMWSDLARILTTTMGLTLLALWWVARSRATALLALPSLGLTTLATLGLLGGLGLPLSPPNLFVLSACTGVGVDAVIHLATRAHELMAEGETPADAVRGSLATAGVPVLWTYAILLCGLAVLLASPMPAVREVALAFGGAMALDLVVTWSTFHALGPWALGRGR